MKKDTLNLPSRSNFCKGSFVSTLGILIFTLSSCIENVYDLSNISSKIDIESSFAIPIASGSMSITQFYPNDSTGNTIIKADSQNLIHLYYKQVFDTLDYADFIGKLEDQHQRIPLLPSNTSLPVGVPIANSFEINFPIATTSPDQIIESTTLDNAMLTIGYTTASTFTPNSQITISSNDIIISNGSTYSITLSATNPRIPISLKGATIKPSTTNKVKYTLTYSITKANATSIKDQIWLSFDLTQIDSRSTIGYLGKKAYNIDMAKINLSFNRNVFEVEDASIDNPIINLEFKNGIDIPFEFKCDEVRASVKGTLYPITGFPTSNIIQKGITTSNSTELSYVKSTATFNKSTNIISLLAKFPEYLEFKGQLISNYEGIAARNEVKKGDRIIISGNMDLPLNIMLKNLVLRDTSHYDFEKISTNADMLETLKITAFLKNGFPANFLVNGYITDASYNNIDSLFEAPILIKSAEIVNQMILSKTESVISSSFSKDRIKKLKAGRHIILIAKATTPNNENGASVKLLSTYNLDIKIVGGTKYNLNNL